MSLERNKKVQAAVVGKTLEIKYETIYQHDFEVEVKMLGDFLAPFEKEVIEEIYFKNCLMIDIPTFDCLSQFAPNFTHLEIKNSKLARIDSEDLHGFGQLIYLNLNYNDIEELPGDLFIYTPNLQHISFTYNKIKVIGENILAPLRNLKSFDLSGNPGIDGYFYELDDEDELVFLKEAIKRCKPVWEIVDEHKKETDALKRELADLKRARAFHKFDFTIKVDGKEFKVQKEVLVANSRVLAQMIRDNEDADTLELKDISEATFEEILSYMHTKQPLKANANFMELYAASGRLQMKELNDLCAQMLMDKVTPQNAMEVLNLCLKFPNIELQKKAYAEYGKSLEK